jgi:cytochrome c oxidase subunit 2
MNPQSALAPAGPQSANIALLFWAMLGIVTVVWILVAGTLLWGLFRRRRDRHPETGLAADTRARRIVSIAVAATVAILVALVVTSAVAARDLFHSPAQDALHIKVTGNQWWWQVEYPDSTPSLHVTTANEIHIPVGRTVELSLASQDVIHSLWIPNLAGKVDLIPYRTNVTWLRADRAGRYRGQCAEYCGFQHAHMALWVVAEPAPEFARWLENQRRPARTPAGAPEQKGQQVFLSQPCVMCHMVQGHGAWGQSAPNLTHLASRATLAASTLPNTRDNLAAWITGTQRIKPGNHMPPVALAPDQLDPLLTYLESLK